MALLDVIDANDSVLSSLPTNLGSASVQSIASEKRGNQHSSGDGRSEETQGYILMDCSL